MSALIVSGSDAREVAKVGGKAAALSALLRAGFDVPAFVAIAPEAFTSLGLCGEASGQLKQQVATLGPGRFAVRSSGREEDGCAHSHAGQFLSLLDVAGDQVGDAALKVWRSGSTDTLRAYRASRGLDPAGGAPAVIVQRLVRARAAGVAFSADPVSGRRDRIVISAVAGLGDRLVGGEADGDDYVIDRTCGAVLQSPAGGGVLTPADLAALAALVRKVEEEQTGPQDIEWAFEGDRLFLLQARPITTKLCAPPIPDPRGDHLRQFQYRRELSGPGLAADLQLCAIRICAGLSEFVALLGVERSRHPCAAARYSITCSAASTGASITTCQLVPRARPAAGLRLNRAYMETMMGVGEPLPAAITDAIGPPPARGLALVREYGRIARVAFGLAREGWRLQRTMRAFYLRLDSALRSDAAAIDAMPLTALAREYRRVESELLERWDAPLINDFLCMMAFGSSRRLIERWAGRAGLELHNDVMIGQGDIVSAEPAQRIARMGALAAGDAALIAALARGDRAAGFAANPALAQEVESYIAKFGDRCTEELKLESITLTEDPGPCSWPSRRRAQAGPAASSRKTERARSVC